MAGSQVCIVDLVVAAGRLLHHEGADKTTLVDIAAAAGVPAGNVCYFKTKDDIVAAVGAAHIANAGAALSAIDDRRRTPKGRPKALAKVLATEKEVIAGYGCPHGSLSSELAKRTGSPVFRLADLMQVPNTLRDPEALTGERDRLERWIDTL